MDDERILELFWARDERALAETSARYGQLCRRLARNIVGNDAEAQECVNDALLAAWNSIPPARPQYFCAYLCKIVRNLALKRLEHNMAQKRTPNALLPLDGLEDILPDEAANSGTTEQELGQLIGAFLRTQRPEARNVFLRKYWYFDSIAAIATRYGMTESKIKVLLHRTRNALRNYLKEEGISL